MKKSLTVLALIMAGASVAAESQTVLFDFGRTNSATNTYETTGAISVNGVYVGNNTHTTINNATGSLSVITGNYAVTIQEGQSSYAGYGVVFNPVAAENEENSWKNPFTGTMPTGFEADTLRDGMTLQNTNNSITSITITLTGLAKGTYDISMFGAYTGSDGSGAGTVSLTQTAVMSFQTYNGSSWTAFSEGASGTSLTMDNAKGYVLNANQIAITEDNSTLAITLTSSDVGGTRTPLNAIQLTYTAASEPVPEPATATLSLLALAGLAARRRRK